MTATLDENAKTITLTIDFEEYDAVTLGLQTIES